MPGFRPGKVPKEHLRRLYGKSVMADVVQNVVNEANQKTVSDHGFKLAMEPAVNFPQDKDKLDAVMARVATLNTPLRSRCCRNSRSPTTATSPSRSSGGGS